MSTCDIINARQQQGDEDLTDDQIQQLLLEAEDRLRVPQSGDSEILDRSEASGNFGSKSAMSG